MSIFEIKYDVLGLPVLHLRAGMTSKDKVLLHSK